ncbi:unnamed protein product [Periconia digitata]|uniref:Uncharacterized protein n=1 Tax=Periconia digitata TaxID=1303443 RepID=A0A9W4U5M7_9PLEO|nr:unnamed protein product [Periconia digitata]
MNQSYMGKGDLSQLRNNRSSLSTQSFFCFKNREFIAQYASPHPPSSRDGENKRHIKNRCVMVVKSSLPIYRHGTATSDLSNQKPRMQSDYPCWEAGSGRMTRVCCCRFSCFSVCTLTVFFLSFWFSGKKT